MNKAKSEPKLANTAQVFSSLVEMRFKPNNQLATEALAKRKEKWEKSKKEIVQIYDPSSMVLHADRKIENNQSRRLKFLVSLSPEHFIVGNENQIDMIGFGAIAHSFVQTDFYWSMVLKGPIESVVVEQKRSLFIILSESTLYFYRYSTKSKELPELITSLVVKEGVRFIRFLKDILLGVFYNSSYQFYNIENLGLIKKKLEKNYPIDSNKKLLTIPSSIENIINVFFEEDKDKKQSFILWCLEINFGTEQIKTRELYRVYDIMNNAKGKLSIQNYTKEIIFMNLDHQIMAIKNGYLIDTVNVSVKGEGEFLKYIHPETILHINKKHVEVYNFSINMAVKPEKIVLRSLDSIQIQRYPENAFYISVLKTNRNFALFFEDSDKKIRQTRGEISYYFEVSQTITVKAKIKSIFDSIGYGQSNPEIIEEKYNMALKMGLTEKEIYLQIWSRSNRSSLQDYQYILATRDYRIIKLEIEKKLKKESMNLRQILKIQESCHEINRQKIESATCSEQDLQDYVSSHFLLQKLKLYKEIHVVDRFSAAMNLPEESGDGSEIKQMKMDIQQYYFFKNLEVKTYILDQINEMLINFKNNAKIIRMTIKDFKFVYRLIYPEILEEIIIFAKDNLINLLNQIPEIMPYIHKDLNEEQRKEGLYGGIWGPIETYQWQKSLYPEIIESIHNKQVLNEFVSSVWFRRYWLTAHGMTGKSKKEILKINEYNNSEKIFYFFIAQLYEHCKNNKPFYYQAINFLQQKYDMFPHHLRNKIVLYENLYTYYFNEEKTNPNRLSLTDFLQLDDESLFKYFFDHQKAKKNSLLKQIKPIYEQSDVNGLHIFNIGLFSYFYSEISQISDLKFILNRINNQKTEFHKKNHGIYQVLVRSMQLKLRIGSPNDIPIDEVMVYIQNIPVNREEQIMQELNVMQTIKSEVAIFQKMKINMTVKDIMDQIQVVVQKLLKYFIEQYQVLKLRDYQQFKLKSIEILKETERIKKKIYSVESSTYSLLVYLSLIMRTENFIEKVATLLQDGEIHHLFQVEEKTIENIVFYMFKWKFSESAKYTDNAEYLRKLLDLLPSENSCRNYLNTQLQLGLILSSNTNQFLYPLSDASHCPSIRTIHEVFKSQSQKYLLELNVERLYQLLSRMQKLVQRDVKKGAQTISLHKLYEILIVELLEKELFREVIDYLQKILHLESQIKNDGIIYVSLYIYKLAKEFNEESKKCIFKLLALYFKEPQSLLKILEFIIKTRLTGLQQTKYLRSILQTESQARFNFNSHNSILSKQFTLNYQHPNAKKVIQVYRDYLKTKNQEFEQNSQYDIIFTILCHSPYLLLKFLQLEKQHLRFKEISMFIHMIVNRPIFNQKKSYEVLKRIFTALIIHNKQSKDIDLLLINFQSKSSEDQFQVPKFNKLNEDQGKIFRIVRSFTRAEKILKRKESLPRDDLKEKKLLQIKNIMDNPACILHDKFDVEEQENYQVVITQEKSFTKKNKPQQISFNEALQKNILFFRRETFAQFLQTYGTQKANKSELELIKRQSSPIFQLNKLSESVKSKKALRNQMIERLHSHKVVNRSENNDDLQSRKDDEQFLDYFLPKKGVNESRQSVGSDRSTRVHGIPQEITTINKNTSKVVSVNQSQNKVDVPVDQIIIDLDQTSKSQEIQERENFEQLREELIKHYNETKIPRFDLTPLQTHIQSLQTQNQKDTTQQIQTFLRNFFNYLYSQSQQTQSLNLKLIQDVARKYHAAGVNNFFLQAYQRIFATHEKHGLEMNIAKLLPLSGVYIKSKDIVDLFHEIQPLIIAKITDENVFKLSKLIALGFRKAIVQQQILFNYLKGLAKTYIKISEEELPPLTQKVKSILHKLQVQVLIDKGEQFFRELPEGERRDLMLNSYTEALKHKGYQSAARDLLSKLS